MTAPRLQSTQRQTTYTPPLTLDEQAVVEVRARLMVLVDRFPHLQRLEQLGWNVTQMLNEDPETVAALEQRPRNYAGPAPEIECCFSHPGLPNQELIAMCRMAAMLGYRQVAVAPTKVGAALKILRGTGIRVNGRPC